MRRLYYGVFLLLLCLKIAHSDLHPNLADLKRDGCEMLKEEREFFFDFLPDFACPKCKYICHAPSSQDKLAHNIRYVSMFSVEHKMSVFSAAIVKSDKVQGVKREKGTRPDWSLFDLRHLGLKKEEEIRLDDYNVFTDFVHGHLFAWDYAFSRDQAKLTMRLANAVPQDIVFNDGIWKWSEEKVKSLYIEDCHNQQGYYAVLITGAVPKYFGDQQGQVLKIGKTSQNSKAYSSDLWSKVEEKDAELATKLTVPTHMWTQFVCYNPDPATVRQGKTQVHSKVSLIGLNYKMGVVKMHEPGITQILKHMYNHDDDQSLSYEGGQKMEELEAEDADETKTWHSPDSDLTRGKFCQSKARMETNKKNKKQLQCKGKKELTSDPLDFWRDVNVFTVRAKNEMRRMKSIAFAYGLRLTAIKDFHVVTATQSRGRKTARQTTPTGDERVKKKKKIAIGDQQGGRGGGRRKRSLDTTSDQNLTTHALRIIDNDPSFDFTLKDCRIWEESSQGEVIETHVYDFETNTLIEDNKMESGSSLTATYTNEDGVEVEADQEPAPKVETISIVLRPRP